MMKIKREKIVEEHYKDPEKRNYGKKAKWFDWQIKIMLTSPPEDTELLFYLTGREKYNKEDSEKINETIKFEKEQIIHLLGEKMGVDIGLKNVSSMTRKLFGEVYGLGKIHPGYYIQAHKKVAKKIKKINKTPRASRLEKINKLLFMEILDENTKGI